MALFGQRTAGWFDATAFRVNRRVHRPAGRKARVFGEDECNGDVTPLVVAGWQSEAYDSQHLGRSILPVS